MAENTTELKEVELELNKVVLTGTITEDFTYHHSTKGANIYKSFICVKRDSGTDDVLPIMASEKVLKEAFSVTEEKSYGSQNYTVCIEGIMASYNEHIENGKSKLILFVKPNNILIVADNTKPSNNIEITGYIVKDVIVRKTPGLKDEKGIWVKQGRTIADVMLGVNINTNKRSVSYYIPCIFWGKAASAIGKLGIGTQVNIHGRVQSRKYNKRYENGNVEEKIAYEISAADAMLVSKNGEVSNLVKVEPKKPVKEKRNKVTVKTRHNPNGFNLD